MKNRTDLFFFYTECLGYARFEQLSFLLQQSIDIEEYISKKFPQGVCRVKLLLFKHYLVEEAIGRELLNREQGRHLIQQKVWELKKHQPPFSLLSIDVELVPPKFFRATVEKLHKEGKFSLEEFKKLMNETLSLPDKYKDAMESLYEKSKPKANIHVEKIVEEDGEVLYKYELNCHCGNFMIVEVEEGSKMRVYCNQCRDLILDLKKKKKSDVQTGKTLDQLVPDLARKLNIETRKFDHYRLIRKLGEGASGKVYLAENLNTKEEVALKVLQQPEKGKQLEYFRREIEILTKLQHPNIVELRECGEFEQKPYFTMEYIPGENLFQVIEKNKIISPKNAAKIMLGVLDALEYAELNNLIHRDVKPANIFISSRGVKLIDLGLAKVLENSLGLTQSGQVMGTPYYIAPEQVSDFKNVCPQADIYSVGASVYHALCGIPPFEEYSDVTMKLLWHKLKGNYMRLHERKPDLPIEIIRIVEKAMAQNLEDRYQSASEMIVDLIDFYQKSTQKIQMPKQ